MPNIVDDLNANTPPPSGVYIDIGVVAGAPQLTLAGEAFALCSRSRKDRSAAAALRWS
jgi:hypothetical protein